MTSIASDDPPIYYQFDGFQAPETVRFLHPALPKQQAHIDSVLKRLGVDEVKVGTEYEFGLTEKHNLPEPQSLSAGEAVNQLRQRVRDHITQMPDQAEAAHRLLAIEKFSPTELLMYELHDLDPRTAGKLEPLFGTGRGDHSYYDAVGCLEVKTKPVSAKANTELKRIFLDTLQERAAAYGLELRMPPEVHLNISFWQQGKNLLDPSHPEFKTTGTKILNGVMRAANESSAMDRMVGFSTAALSPSRDHSFRFIGEGDRARLELRMGDGYGGGLAWKDPETFIECVAKPGAAYGLEHGNIEGMEFAKRGVFSRTGEDFKVTLHTLQGATLQEAEPGVYKIHLPENYLSSKGRDVAEELGIQRFDHMYDKASIDVEKLSAQQRHDGRLPHEDAEMLRDCKAYLKTPVIGAEELKKIFNNIRITEHDGRWKMSWPDAVQNAGGVRIEINAPKISSNINCDGVVDTVLHEGYPRRDRLSERFLFKSHVFDADRGYLTQEARVAMDALLKKEIKEYRKWRRTVPLPSAPEKMSPALIEQREPISSDLAEMVSAMRGEGLREEQPVTPKQLGGKFPEVLSDPPRLSPRAISNPEFATALLPKEGEWVDKMTASKSTRKTIQPRATDGTDPTDSWRRG